MRTGSRDFVSAAQAVLNFIGAAATCNARISIIGTSIIVHACNCGTKIEFNLGASNQPENTARRDTHARNFDLRSNYRTQRGGNTEELSGYRPSLSPLPRPSITLAEEEKGRGGEEGAGHVLGRLSGEIRDRKHLGGKPHYLFGCSLFDGAAPGFACLRGDSGKTCA